MSDHTPTPWKRSRDHWLRILDASGKKVCEVAIAFRSTDEAAANAALIVRAVNSHAALRAALEEIRANAAEFTHGDTLVQHLVQGIFNTADKALCPEHHARRALAEA